VPSGLPGLEQPECGRALERLLRHDGRIGAFRHRARTPRAPGAPGPVRERGDDGEAQPETPPPAPDGERRPRGPWHAAGAVRGKHRADAYRRERDAEALIGAVRTHRDVVEAQRALPGVP